MRPQTALALFLLAAALRSSHAQLSKAIADDTNVDSSTNKFLNREAFADQDTKDAPGRYAVRFTANLFAPLTQLALSFVLPIPSSPP
jgi:hypothetical protein